MNHPEYLVVPAIAAVLLLVPLFSQLRTRNVALLTLTINMFLLSVMHSVNAVVWAGNVRDVAPVWCDIATNFHYYESLSALAAALCICKNLEWLSSTRGASSNRMHCVLFEITLCCVFALVTIPIRYAFASNRYMILEDLGCYSSFYPSTLMVVFVTGPHIVIALIGFIFACMAAGNLICRRISTRHCNSQSILTTSRFVRLLALCLVVGVWPVIAVFLIVRFFFVSELSSWPGWAAAHKQFHLIPLIPLSVQRLIPGLPQPYITNFWSDSASAYLVFAILACTEEVQGEIFNVWNLTLGKVLCLPCSRHFKATLPSSQRIVASSTSSDEPRNSTPATSIASIPSAKKVFNGSQHEFSP